MLRKDSVSEEQKQLDDEGLALFNRVDNKKNYVASIVAFVIAGLFLLFAVFSLPLVILSPQKFVLFFTISMISTLVGLAFLNGPQTYLKKLTIRKNRIATGVLLLSIIIMAVVIPARAARDPNPRRGFKRALFWFMAYCFFYVFALKYAFFRLS